MIEYAGIHARTAKVHPESLAPGFWRPAGCPGVPNALRQNSFRLAKAIVRRSVRSITDQSVRANCGGRTRPEFPSHCT